MLECTAWIEKKKTKRCNLTVNVIDMTQRFHIYDIAIDYSRIGYI